MGTLVDSLASRLSAIVLNDAQSNGIPSSMIGPIEKSLANIEVIVHLKHSLVMATLCLYVYDYLCTLDQEVAYVWSQSRTFGTFLFFVNRYLPFTDLILSFYALNVYQTPQQCDNVYTAVICLNLAGMVVSEVILALRTIAIWERNKLVTLCTGCALLAWVIISITVTTLYLKSMIYVPTDPRMYFGCFLVSSSTILSINYIAICILETVLLALTLIRVYKHLRFSKSSWVHQLYTQGFIFYIYLLGLNILNIIFPPIFVHLPAFQYLFLELQRTLHAMFCNRIIFFILSHQVKYAQRPQQLDRRMTTVSPEDVLTSILDTYMTRGEVDLNEEQEATGGIDHLAYGECNGSYRDSWR